MIILDGVAARRAPLALTQLSLAWGPGVHAVVGTPSDGGSLLLELIAGRARLRAGRLRVLDGRPADAAVRGALALVLAEAALPEALTAAEVLALAASVRGEPARDPVARLAALGIEALAPRRVRTLAAEEARAVALAEALTSTRVRVALLEEPLVGVDTRASSRLPALLRARGRDGWAVVVATASLRDAGDVADDHVLLRGGTLAGTATSLGELAAFSAEGVRMRVVSSDPRALLAAVAREPAVDAVGRREGAVVARGRDATALAAAVGRAVVASGVEVAEMRLEPPSLDDARAASAGVGTATYEAAYARTRAALEPAPAVGTGPATEAPPASGTTP